MVPTNASTVKTFLVSPSLPQRIVLAAIGFIFFTNRVFGEKAFAETFTSQDGFVSSWSSRLAGQDHDRNYCVKEKRIRKRTWSPRRPESICSDRRPSLLRLFPERTSYERCPSAVFQIVIPANKPSMRLSMTPSDGHNVVVSFSLPTMEQIKQAFDFILHPLAGIASMTDKVVFEPRSGLHDNISGLLYAMMDPSTMIGSVATILRFVQTSGENIFVAALAVAFIQGAAVLYAYRNNPRGELVVPPGLTWGVELPRSKLETGDAKGEEKSQTMLLDSDEQHHSFQRSENMTIQERLTTMPGKKFMIRMNEVVQESLNEQEMEKTENVNNEDTVEKQTTLDKVKQAPDKMKRSLKRVNQYAVILLPWMVQQMSFIMAQYGHLMHLGMIFGVGSLLELRKSKIPPLTGSVEKDIREDDSAMHQSLTRRSESGNLGNPLKVVVIGDSLACGIGTIDRFDELKNNTTPFALIENIGAEGSTDVSEVCRLLAGQTVDSTQDRQKGKDGFGNRVCPSPYRESVDHSVSDPWGPAFPRILAATLAQRVGRPVQWRSAGVDGGDVQQIGEYCLGVLREEVSSGHSPDIVVILCGPNDLKTILGSPLDSFATEGGPAGKFRLNLIGLLRDVLSISPETKVVLPALPTHRLDQGSLLNVFPLTFVLDALLAVWDAQKKKIADSSPSNIIYCGLSYETVSAWYRMPSDAFQEDIDDAATLCGNSTVSSSNDGLASTLISLDGVHPNKRCYSLWANYVGNIVADTFLPRDNHSEHQPVQSGSDAPYNKKDIPRYFGNEHSPVAKIDQNVAQK